MLEECRKAGHEDRALMFCSLSKVTFPVAGVAAMAASRRNIDYILKNMFPMIISFDKLNQVRHIRFLKDMDGLAAHMEKHRALLEPKFRAVLAILDEGLSGCGSIDSFPAVVCVCAYRHAGKAIAAAVMSRRFAPGPAPR